MSGLFPIVTFENITLGEANEMLVQWGHRMGPICRPQYRPDECHALIYGDKPVAVTVTSQLIRSEASQSLAYMTRENTVELSRLCACRSGLCRVALRLWREFIFAEMPYEFALSYQDADLHNGNTYRFDGWQRVGYSRKGGVDRRSGAQGRNKWLWQWPPTREGGTPE